MSLTAWPYHVTGLNPTSKRRKPCHPGTQRSLPVTNYKKILPLNIGGFLSTCYRQQPCLFVSGKMFLPDRGWRHFLGLFKEKGMYSIHTKRSRSLMLPEACCGQNISWVANRVLSIPTAWHSPTPSFGSLQNLTTLAWSRITEPASHSNLTGQGAQWVSWTNWLREVVKCHLFVAAFPFSGYFYVEAFPNEQIHCWIQGIMNALSFFRGVPVMLRPENC